jgi:predicted choloylglycine hydrolase
MANARESRVACPTSGLVPARPIGRPPCVRLPAFALLAGLVLPSVALGAEFDPAANFKPATFGPASLRIVDGIPIIHLYGSHQEMGRQYGTLLKPNLAALLDGYLPKLLRTDERRKKVLALAKEMEKHIPAGYRAETKALAAAAGIPYDDVLLANTVFDLRSELYCSSLVAVGKRSGDGKPIFGRNLDFFPLGIADRHSCVIVFHPDAGRPVAAIGFPGLVGIYSGMNDAGLSAGANMVFRRGYRTDAPPYAMVFRTALARSKTTAEALQIVRETRRSTSNNLMLCDAEGDAALAELDPKETAVRRPEKGVVYSTNHFRSAELRQAWPCWRVAMIQRMLARAGRIDEPWIRRMLRAVGQKRLTMHSMIFRPASVELVLAIGKTPATQNTYVRLRKAVLFPAKPATP